MATLRAVLTFPWRSADATHELAGRRAALAVPLFPAAAVAVYLQARGAGPTDAWCTGLAVLLLILGLGLGGVMGSLPARHLLGGTFRLAEHVAPCLVFGTWTPVLFVVLLLLAKAAGAQEKAALFAGFAVLVWGIVCGISVVGGSETEDRGRALVASCLGLAIALIGLLAALMVIQARLVLARPAPVAADGFKPGDLLLVRREQHPESGTLVFLRQVGTREAVLARTGEPGVYRPVGAEPGAIEKGEWRPEGRVFFRLNGPWGGSFIERNSKPRN